jgi:hypothetical protein
MGSHACGNDAAACSTKLHEFAACVLERADLTEDEVRALKAAIHADELRLERAVMLANANQYTDIGPTPVEIARREAAALDGLSEADVEIVRRRAQEIRRARFDVAVMKEGIGCLGTVTMDSAGSLSRELAHTGAACAPDISPVTIEK